MNNDRPGLIYLNAARHDENQDMKRGVLKLVHILPLSFSAATAIKNLVFYPEHTCGTLKIRGSKKRLEDGNSVEDDTSSINPEKNKKNKNNNNSTDKRCSGRETRRRRRFKQQPWFLTGGVPLSELESLPILDSEKTDRDQLEAAFLTWLGRRVVRSELSGDNRGSLWVSRSNFVAIRVCVRDISSSSAANESHIQTVQQSENSASDKIQNNDIVINNNNHEEEQEGVCSSASRGVCLAMFTVVALEPKYSRGGLITKDTCIFFTGPVVEKCSKLNMLLLDGDNRNRCRPSPSQGRSEPNRPGQVVSPGNNPVEEAGHAGDDKASKGWLSNLRSSVKKAVKEIRAGFLAAFTDSSDNSSADENESKIILNDTTTGRRTQNQSFEKDRRRIVLKSFSEFERHLERRPRVVYGGLSLRVGGSRMVVSYTECHTDDDNRRTATNDLETAVDRNGQSDVHENNNNNNNSLKNSTADNECAVGPEVNDPYDYINYHNNTHSSFADNSNDEMADPIYYQSHLEDFFSPPMVCIHGEAECFNIQVDSAAVYEKIHIVPFADTVPVSYALRLFEDGAKPYLESHSLTLFMPGDTFTHNGVQFKVLYGEPEYKRQTKTVLVHRFLRRVILASHLQPEPEPRLVINPDDDRDTKIRKKRANLRRMQKMSATFKYSSSPSMHHAVAQSSNNGDTSIPLIFAPEEWKYKYSFRSAKLIRIPDVPSTDGRRVSPDTDIHIGDPVRPHWIDLLPVPSQRFIRGLPCRLRGPALLRLIGDLSLANLERVMGGADVRGRYQEAKDAAKNAILAEKICKKYVRNIQPEENNSALPDESGEIVSESGLRWPENRLQSYRETNSSSGMCTVCLGGYLEYEEVLDLPCGHIFHFACASQWFARRLSCPLCKMDLEQLDLSEDVKNEENRDGGQTGN